jgi:hypothetical protein
MKEKQAEIKLAEYQAAAQQPKAPRNCPAGITG